MASVPLDRPPQLRCESPSPDTSPAPALRPHQELARCFSAASSISHGSATTDASRIRHSLGSDFSAYSRHSSASFLSSQTSDAGSGSFSPLTRQTTGLNIDGRPISGLSRRRGYMRPHGTDFAQSARSRESVMSLGSIAHIQYYFARTGLLDGKGGQLARKRQQKAQTLDFSSLDTSSFLNPGPIGSDVDSSYASMGSSPDLANLSSGGALVESPIEEPLHGANPDEEYYSDDFDDLPGDMLPPTASTYNYREKPLPKPPSITELKAELTAALDAASSSLHKTKDVQVLSPSPSPSPSTPSASPRSPNRLGTPKAPHPGLYEVQGMHILDVMTLAIRAAKVYYISHDQPDRLDLIKSERELRSELLAVMDVLKRMAARGFAGGIRDEEFAGMDGWISSVRKMLAAEEETEAAENAERDSWTWLRDEGWEGREYEREYAFLESILAGSGPITSTNSGIHSPSFRPSSPVDANLEPGTPTINSFNAAPIPTSVPVEPLPPWNPIDRSRPLEEQELPTPFLATLRSGVMLVHLHNCAVRRSRRRFGAVPSFHTDTAKPYRAADNIRFWAKAAELRWEVLLHLDALSIVYGSPLESWLEFEDAILAWCRKVRHEIASEFKAT